MISNKNNPQDIYGLVLVGGESRRMGQNKALLSYDGQTTQLEQTCHLLQKVCPRTFISQRADQNYEIPEGITPIYDSLEDIEGPLRGILSAMQAYPDVHWLVLACDLPNLTEATLKTLIGTFQNTQPALTAYQSTYDGLPEPLCAIYPSESQSGLYALARKLGKSCPRKLLILKEATLIQQEDPRSLDNVNTAEEFQAITDTLS